MLFSNLFFIYIFLPFLFVLYYPFKSIAWRNSLLVVFSLLFYAWGEPVFVLLTLFCVAANYLFELIISHYKRLEKRKNAKIFLAAAVIVNISLLAVFKYAGFFVQTINLLPGVSLTVPQIALPLGISFFTFQAMSYTIDIYRGDAPEQRNFFRLLLYVSLFPQLIAGPIVRYRDICDRLGERTVSLESINEGIFRFTCGLAKKALIANPCGSAADSLLGVKLSDATVLGAWTGALFFAMQIYFDFSGYSDMAVGLGKMLGFEFPENFNYPYISRSATDFWRRWHISLGAFFRDYLYIPLGGNRSHWLRNVLIVWLLTGMWHGASWNFIVWGLYYALLLIFEKKLFIPLLNKMNRFLSAAVSGVYMTVVTLVGWTVFYYTDGFAGRLGVMFGVNAPLGDIYEISILRSNLFLLIAAVILATPLIPKLLNAFARRFTEERRYVLVRASKGVFSALAAAASTVMLAGNTYNPFLYFRF